MVMPIEDTALQIEGYGEDEVLILPVNLASELYTRPHLILKSNLFMGNGNAENWYYNRYFNDNLYGIDEKPAV